MASDANDVMKVLAPYAPAFAIAIGLAWLGSAVALLLYVGEQEVTWARLVFLFGSIEALAFAVVGAIFGTQVQRQRVEKAEQSAREAEQRAVKAEDRAAGAEDEVKEIGMVAAKGKQLAAAVRAEAQVMAASTAKLFEGERFLASESRESLRLANELR